MRVVEFGEMVAVPYAGRVLRDLGAELVKVELRPEGDPARRYGPFPAGDSSSDHSALFAYLNAGKKAIALGPEEIEAGAASPAVAQLVAWADVVLIDDTWARRLDLRAGLAPLQARHQHAVIATVTPYGWDGPYSDYPATDLTMSAMGGVSYGVGDADGPPLPLPYSQTEFHAGACAAIAVQMAYLARTRLGVGQHIDIGIAELLASLHTGYFLVRFMHGGVVGRRSGRAGSGTPYPNTVLDCADGFVSLNTPQAAQWVRLIHLLGDPDWSHLPRYRNRRSMQWDYKDEADALIGPWFAERTKAELERLFVENRLPYAVLKTGRDLLNDRHLAARGKLRRIRLGNPEVSDLVVPGPDHDGLVLPAVWQDLAAPALGEHEQFRADIREGPRSAARVTGAEPLSEHISGPLAGFRVLDLGTAWAGGIAGRILGDFGCDVIKVESWSHMDGSRKGRPIMSDDVVGGDEGSWPDLQPGFHVHGRNKRSIAVNLKTAAGADLLRRLISRADVLLHNFPPAVMDRLGFSAEAIHSVNPQCVVVGQSIAGSNGPLRDYIGYAHTVSALAGLAAAVGYEGADPIGHFEGLYCDIVSALAAVNGAVAGLISRSSSDRGPAVDISQVEATLALCAEGLLLAQWPEGPDGPRGSYHPLYSPHGSYAAAGDDEWLTLAVRDDADWRHLCDLLDARPDWYEADLATRRVLSIEINEAISGWTTKRPPWDSVRLLIAAGIPAAPVYNVESVFADEHFQTRDTFVYVDHPLAGTEAMCGMPWRFAATPGSVRRAAPLLGQHSREVAMELAGLTEAEYEQLVRDGVIETGPAQEAILATKGESGRE